MTPYYDDGTCVIYHGDCRDLLPDLATGVSLVLADPPYGVGIQTNYASRQRGSLARCNDYGPTIHGDDEPFDPSHILALNLPTVLFGANHYADRLPSSPSWIVWDKLDGLTSRRPVGFNDQADVELAWTNLGGPARLIAHRWMGAMKSGPEAPERRLHPTQKPIALMTRIIQHWAPNAALVLDPYMGSGPVLRAAKDLGRRAIGVEIEERYCEVAANRLAQEVLPL